MEPPDADRPPLPDPVLEAALEIWSRAGEQHLIPITGRSMRPLIRDGDLVLVAHGHADVRQGDVVVFRREGKLVAHRVLRVYGAGTGKRFLTKGDNAPQFDPLLGAEEIVGRVLAVRRGDRQMSLDTTAWRSVGRFVAVATLAWTKLYGWCRHLKQRLLGPEPNRLTALLRRGALASQALVLKAAQAVFSRWKA